MKDLKKTYSIIWVCQNCNGIFHISVFAENQSDLTEDKDQRSAYLYLRQSERFVQTRKHPL